jgi:hypothetical protein
MKILSGLKSIITKNFRELDKIHRDKAIEDLQWEVQELKHIFAITTMGFFVGLPSAPLPVTFSLLPDMHEEFAIMLARLETAHSPFSDQFSRLDVI